MPGKTKSVWAGAVGQMILKEDLPFKDFSLTASGRARP